MSKMNNFVYIHGAKNMHLWEKKKNLSFSVKAVS